MAGVSVVEVAHDTVVKVATGTTSADILIKNPAKKYWQTFRAAAATAPAKPTAPDAVDGEWFRLYDAITEFRPTASADLYIYCAGEGSASGYVRIDT